MSVSLKIGMFLAACGLVLAAYGRLHDNHAALAASIAVSGVAIGWNAASITNNMKKSEVTK